MSGKKARKRKKKRLGYSRYDRGLPRITRDVMIFLNSSRTPSGAPLSVGCLQLANAVATTVRRTYDALVVLESTGLVQKSGKGAYRICDQQQLSDEGKVLLDRHKQLLVQEILQMNAEEVRLDTLLRSAQAMVDVKSVPFRLEDIACILEPEYVAFLRSDSHVC